MENSKTHIHKFTEKHKCKCCIVNCKCTINWWVASIIWNTAATTKTLPFMSSVLFLGIWGFKALSILNVYRNYTAPRGGFQNVVKYVFKCKWYRLLNVFAFQRIYLLAFRPSRIYLNSSKKTKKIMYIFINLYLELVPVGRGLTKHS